ncbi:CSG1/SUR1-like protein [Neonectria punicea]|uniref:CSG1/SUR1-like protein n=1 Tax=Neonectria punicea TaxID=979145 RepID=A0ABR1HRJ9_9HYPO
MRVPVLPNVRPDMRELGDNWAGVFNPSRRKKLQNRLNQRARRRRMKTQENPPTESTELLPTETFEGCQLLTCPTRIAQARSMMRQAYEDYTLRVPRPAALHILIRLNVLTALARNASLMGFPPEGLCRDDFISPHNTRGPRLADQPDPDISCLGPLQPTALQKTVVHHPWIDLFPFPPFRDNVLVGMAAGLVDDDELCADILEVQDEDLASKPSLIVWGQSSDSMSWEANPSFFRKWGFLVRGCPEIVDATNYWRAKRGETKVIFEVVGKSGLRVSQIILGCMSFGDKNWQPWLLDKDEALPILKYAFERGINTWDVADTYSNGRSEEIAGAAIREHKIPRSKLVIMSKCFQFVDEERGPVDPAVLTSNDGPRVNRVGLSRKHILDAVGRSVERLGTYIDVLQIHRMDREVAPEEIMKALNDVIESGKVRYIGGSSMAVWEFQMLQNVARKNGWHEFISMQGMYNLLYREEEREMNPYCNFAGVGLFPWSPVAAGVLAHPWTDRTGDREQNDPFLKMLFRSVEHGPDKAIVERVAKIAKSHGTWMAQVAQAWLMSKGCTPVCGLETQERIDQAVGALDVQLTEDDVQHLEELYVPKLAMPF